MNNAADKHILIIGANSPIAQICIEYFLRHDFKVTASSQRKDISNFKHKYADRLSFEHLILQNIGDKYNQDWFDNFDIIISIAPITLSKNLIPLIKQQDNKRVIFISSYNVHRFNCSNHYIPLKIAEAEILDNLNNAIILQPTAIIGHKSNSLIKAIWFKAQRRTPFIGIWNQKSLQQPLDYRDLAGALIHAAKTRELGPGRYPVSGSDILNSKEFYQKISKVINKTITYIALPHFLIKAVQYFFNIALPHHPMTAYLSRIGSDRHVIHDPLPNWQPEYNFRDSLKNLQEKMDLHLE